jgi:AmiR/NasT family two-component response regulator
MAQRQIDEATAYAWLRRTAMNENRRIAEIAAELLEKAAAMPLRRSGDAK